MSDYYVIRHHGIKGMKWGVRRFRDKGGRLTAAGKQRYSKGDSHKAESDDDSAKKKIQLSDKQKKALKIGAVAVGVTLAACGAYKLSKINVNLDSNVFLDSQLKRKVAESVDFETQIKDDLRRINRGGKKGAILLRDRNQNCTSCSMAYELRRRGYDVIAAPLKAGRSNQQVESFFQNAKFKSLYSNGTGVFLTHPTDQQIIDVKTALLSQGEGARGFLHGYKPLGGGHSIAYEIHNGKVHILDGQIGKRYKSVEDAISRYGALDVLRTDNLALANRAAETVRNNTTASILKELPSNAAIEWATELGAGAAIIGLKARRKRKLKEANADESETDKNHSRAG